MTYKITEGHLNDLRCAALNGGPDTQAIFERMEKEGFEVVPSTPINLQLFDYSVNFMYPSSIRLLSENQETEVGSKNC